MSCRYSLFSFMTMAGTLYREFFTRLPSISPLSKASRGSLTGTNWIFSAACSPLHQPSKAVNS